MNTLHIFTYLGFSTVTYLEAQKDEQGKSYLDQAQFETFKAFHEHINKTGKIDEFVNTNTVTLATTEQTNIEVSPEEIYSESEDPILQFDLNSLLRSVAELKAREIAMPALRVQEPTLAASHHLCWSRHQSGKAQ